MRKTLDNTPSTAAPIVLISDDDVFVRQGMGDLLELSGLTVLGGGDAAETLRICQTQQVDLLITDLMKPGMDGFAMLERLRANPATRAIPFVVCSAHTSPAIIERAHTLGAQAYLIKPLNPRTFETTILGVLGKLGFAAPTTR